MPDEYTDIKGMVMGFEEKKVVLQIDGKRKSIAATQYIIDNISTKVLSDIHVTTCNGVIIDICNTDQTTAGTHLLCI